MSPCVSPMTLSFLSELIRIHLELFRDCYPSVHLTPKLHYMIHFVEQMERFGPLIRYWCMRMEAKNAYTKRSASGGNFKNVELSFAERHQRLLAYHLSNSDVMKIDFETGPAHGSVILEKASSMLINAIQATIPDVDNTVNTEYLHKPKWIKYGSIEYRPGVIIFTKHNGVLPVFAAVKEIFVIHSTPLLLVSELETCGLEDHYRSYIVTNKDTEEQILYNMNALPDFSVLHLHKTFSQNDKSSYICLKWNIETVV